MYYCYLDTPIGELLLAGEEGGLSMIGFPDARIGKIAARQAGALMARDEAAPHRG